LIVILDGLAGNRRIGVGRTAEVVRGASIDAT
jgi:hypothetical protein